MIILSEFHNLLLNLSPILIGYCRNTCLFRHDNTKYAQPKNSVIPETVSHQEDQNEVVTEITDNTNVQPTTSKGTTLTLPAQPNKTLMVPATSEETRTTIDALLSLGSDLQMGLDVEQMDNELLQPIAPGNILPDLTPMVSEINSDDTEILGEQAALDEEDN